MAKLAFLLLYISQFIPPPHTGATSDPTTYSISCVTTDCDTIGIMKWQTDLSLTLNACKN